MFRTVDRRIRRERPTLFWLCFNENMTGADFEDYVRTIFEENGYHALGTPASGDYGVDLVLNGYIAVQVKM